MRPELELGLPGSVDAECAILGSILLDNSALDEAPPEEAFSLDSHRRIMRAMRDMQKADIPIDLLTLLERLRQRKEIESIGGVAYLAWLTEQVNIRVSGRNTEEYARIIRDKAALRGIISVCTRAIVRSTDQGEESPVDIVTEADRALLAITAESRSTPSLEEQSNAAFERMERRRTGQETAAYDFGIPALDKLVGGLVPREMTVLGGRPGQGKTGLTSQIIARHCPRGIPVHAFELEMTADQLLYRLWAIVAGVPFQKLRHPERQSPEEHKRVAAAKREVASWPLVVDDASSLETGQLVSLARLQKRRQSTRIVIVDYLQKMRFSGKPEHRYLQVTDAAVQLARLAKDEDLAVLLLSSVSEKSASNRNSAPTLQDFRQSGDIAYEAHCALLIHREIDDETEKPKNEGIIIVAKARSDETGVVSIRFDAQSLEFEDLADARRRERWAY